uniref:AAA+ ATPase domain-containing protein n=1 Tax=viral metagenome TaxID=1070528 RepID=A0A6C0KRP3_9ZZZZ
MYPSPIPTGNSMIEMLKSQLMTMTMISSMNGPEKTGNFFNVIYIFLATGIIDFLCKSVFPGLGNIITKYYREQINANKLINKIVTSEGNNIKSASITVLVNIADHENMFGQALLDYVTNNEKTKHISFKKQNFVLNQSDIIEIYEEYFVKLNENKMVDATDKSGNEGIEQTIELFSYRKSMQELRAFLNKITHEYKIKIENKLGDKMYYFNQHPMNAPTTMNGRKDYTKLPNNSVFTMKVFQTNRKFTNLFGPEISIVRKRVEFFTKNRKWYDTKGIPYTLGLLLSGQAGAGKTSSIKCLANETKRHIININLNNDITKTQLENLFFNELIVVLNVSTGQTEKYYIPLDQRIYVLEDIDAQSDLVMERTTKVTAVPDVPVSIKTNPNKPDTNSNDDSWVQSEKIDLSFLLNLLDGVLEIPGRIVMMTSNFPEKLDHALVRPGRIDVIANFTKCSHPTMIEMMEFFYDIVLSDEEKEAIFRTKEYVISPAEMSKIMFENFGNHAGAIQKLGEIGGLSLQSIESEELPIEVETTDKAISHPQMVNEIEKEKLVESSPETRTSILDLDINSRLDNLTKTYFPDDNRIDRINDRKQQLSRCASYISGNIHTPPDANWLKSVGNEVTGKCFTPPHSTNVIVPYGSESQTNRNSSDYVYELKDFILDPVDKIDTFSDYKYETNQFSAFE